MRSNKSKKLSGTPTIKDVAERAGVSITTVSHALNQTRYVNHELVRRVRNAVRSLSYQPNALARGLRRKETRMFGMVMPDNSNPYFAELARSIEDACFERGYNVILCNSDEDPVKEQAYLSLLVEKQVDGIVFVASDNDCGALRNVRERDVPVVVLDRELKGMPYDSIVVDNRHGGRQAASHLIAGGHRRIGCICGPTYLTSAKERLEGYRDALLDAGLPLDPKLIQAGNFHIEAGYAAMENLFRLPDPITAVFASNDLMAIGALRAIAARALRVPDDVSVVGFDDVSLAMYTEPPLTTVTQPICEIGTLATELLVRRVNGDHRRPRRCCLETRLVVRASCGIEPVAQSRRRVASEPRKRPRHSQPLAINLSDPES